MYWNVGNHCDANLLTLASQSDKLELFESKFKEMTEQKARLAAQLEQAEKMPKSVKKNRHR